MGGWVVLLALTSVSRTRAPTMHRVVPTSRGRIVRLCDLSLREAQPIRTIGGTDADTYGEMTAQGFSTLAGRMGLCPSDHFLDVGSGHGKLVVQACNFGVASSRGVEISATRHRVAQRLLDASPHHVRRRSSVECADASTACVDHTTAVYLSNLMFSAELTSRIAVQLETGRDIRVIGVMVPFAPGTLPSFIEDESLAMCEMSWSLQGAGTAVTVYRRVLPPQTRAPAKEDEATAFEAERAMERVRAVERMEAMGSIEEISGAGCSSGVEMSDAEASGVETGVEAISSTSPRLAVVALTQLVGRHSEAASRLCDGLRRDHVAIVELPPSSRAAIDRMWSCVEEFYTRPLAARQAHGPLHEAEHCDTHLGQPRLVGFTQLSGNACLDTRVRRRPASSGGAPPVLELLPAGVGDDAFVPGFAEALVEAQEVLFGVGMAALRLTTDSMVKRLEERVQVRVAACLAPKPADTALVSQLELKLRDGVDALACAPDTRSLPGGATSATVHRLVCYEAKDRGGATTSPPPIAFAAHTDGTWFTVIPCAGQAGLEVLTSHGWLGLEKHARHGIDVAVLTGDFLQSLSTGEYSAAMHRVAEPLLPAARRLSAPLLMRASPAYRELCKQADKKRRAQRA